MVIVVATGAWRAKRRGPIVMMLLVLTVPLLAERGPSGAQAGPAVTPAAETFTYDHEFRLVQAIVGGNTSIYAYNGDGLRVSRTVGAATTTYTWDVASALPVVLQDSDGNTYVYGLDLISTTDNAGAQTYHLYDGLGSTTDLVDGSGNSVASYGYDVFGATRTHSGSSPNYWLFTGEQRDSESDLYYLRARYYDPSIGRFLTRDPFGGLVLLPQSLNGYPYVLDNPTNLVDPYGYWGLKDAWKSAKDIGGAIGGGIEAGARWVGEDYHWATVGAAAGGIAFTAGIVLLTSPVSVPLGGAILTTGLISGGLGVGAPLTIISIAHSGKQCAAGDTCACVSAAVGGVSAPSGFLPGPAAVEVGFSLLPVFTDVAISATNICGGQSQQDGQKE